ncbi:MAG TPA: DUF2231 domain-containing protein [Gammaproteobacteria bacterium]
MIEIIPNYHPIFVHFTLGLLGSSVGLYVLTRFVSKPDLKHQLLIVAHWNLWLGTLVTIVTIAAGWYAFNTVEHDDPSHVVMKRHRALALGTFAVVLILAAWSWLKYRPAKQVNAIFLVSALFAAGVLVATAWHGAELVFRHGLGVIALPDLKDHRHGGGHSQDTSGPPPLMDADMEDIMEDSDEHVDNHSQDGDEKDRPHDDGGDDPGH